VPDLAIEIIWTGGGLEKLDICRRLGVREVWVRRGGGLTIVALHGDGYEGIARSHVLPQVDIELVRSLMELPTQTAAVRELRSRLRRQPGC
jgi:Uma2 family endonuclease